MPSFVLNSPWTHAPHLIQLRQRLVSRELGQAQAERVASTRHRPYKPDPGNAGEGTNGWKVPAASFSTPHWQALWESRSARPE